MRDAWRITVQAVGWYVEQLVGHIRLADVADVLLMSVVLYGVLVWLRRAATPLVFGGILALAGIYAAARAFDLYLILMMFHGLFVVLLIGLVIVFQDDLRRMLQGSPRWSWFDYRQSGGEYLALQDVLVQSVYHLGANGTGALIILQGRERLDPHLEGGVPLDGQPSKLLLYSIFDPHSPGHDGALVIDAQRVTRFAVHLPLARNREQVGVLGTRHSAGLGLSERCDALVLIVSEERGTVSVAEDGKLDEVSSPADLKDRLERFRARRFPPSVPAGWPRRLARNLGAKVFALALACAGWLLFVYQPDIIERTFVVPIQYLNAPDNVVLGEAEPSEARVTLRGPEAAFSLLDPENLRVSIDLRRAAEGIDEFAVTARSVNQPSDLTVTRIEPPVVRVRLAADEPNEMDRAGEPRERTRETPDAVPARR